MKHLPHTQRIRILWELLIFEINYFDKGTQVNELLLRTFNNHRCQEYILSTLIIHKN